MRAGTDPVPCPAAASVLLVCFRLPSVRALTGGDWAQVYKNRVGLDIGDGNRDGVYEVCVCQALVRCHSATKASSSFPLAWRSRSGQFPNCCEFGN